MTLAVQRDGGAAIVKKTIDRALVDRFQMVDLQECVQQHLDVARDIEALLGHETPAVRLELLEILEEWLGVLQQRFGGGVLVDEYPVVEALAAHADQSARGQIQAGKIALVAQIDQSAVERVRPAVIAADEAVGLAAGGLDQRAAAMAAGVVKRSHDIVLAAHDQYR